MIMWHFLDMTVRKGRGPSLFTRANSQDYKLNDPKGSEGGGQKVCPFVHFQNNL